MAINNHATLAAAIAEWLRNQDAALIARVPAFIKLAEAEFSRQSELDS